MKAGEGTFSALQKRLAQGKGKIAKAARQSQAHQTSWGKKGAKFAVKK